MESISDMAGAGADLKLARRQKASRADGPNIDRLPPHSASSEQGTLGCQMLSPMECVPIFIMKSGGDVEVYYDLRHQTIQKCILSLYEDRTPIDMISMQDWLKQHQLLDQVGGILYFGQLIDSTPSAANLEYYLSKVVECHTVRRMIRTCSEIVGRAYEFTCTVDELLDEAEKDFMSIRPASSQEITPIKVLVNDAISSIEKDFERKNPVIGLATGFIDLDVMTGGLNGPDVWVIAARPSMGKTSLGWNIAEHVVLELKQEVGFFSLEMSAAQLVKRSLCSCARVNHREITRGFIHESDFPKLTNAAGKLGRAKIFIDDTAGLSILNLRARARRMVQQYGCKLFVIDYLQLLNSKTRRSQDNRQQEVADISSGIKALAKELNVPIIVLAQLNREFEREGKKRKPRLSDLRESGAIEQDADLVGLLYKVNLGDDEESDEDQFAVPTNLLIAKQRNGPTGDVNLTFIKQFTRFESAAKISDEDAP